MCRVEKVGPFSTRGSHIYPKTNLFYRALRGKIRLFVGKYATREKKKASFTRYIRSFIHLSHFMASKKS